jgi:hypothetical protein
MVTGVTTPLEAPGTINSNKNSKKQKTQKIQIRMRL